jgi:hypothetical protein
VKFACPPISVNHQSAAFRISSGIGAKFARDVAQASRLGEQLQRANGRAGMLAGSFSVAAKVTSIPKFKFASTLKLRFDKIFDDFKPMVDYRLARRCASRRHGWIADLELPGEAGIGDLAAALNALAIGGDKALLERLHRRLRRQARNGDTQSAALADWLDLVRMQLAAEALQRMLDWLATQERIRELVMLARLRATARAAARRRRRPRREQDPVRTRRCSRAPNDVSSLPLCPEVAA